MCFRKKFSIFITVLFSCFLCYSINTQENENAAQIMRQFVMATTKDEAIGRFPENLQFGFEWLYLCLTSSIGGHNRDEAVQMMNVYLNINYMKENIIQKGKGNDPFGGGENFSSFYNESKSEILSLTREFISKFGRLQDPGGTRGDVRELNRWYNNLLEYL